MDNKGRIFDDHNKKLKDIESGREITDLEKRIAKLKQMTPLTNDEAKKLVNMSRNDRRIWLKKHNKNKKAK